MNGVTFGSYNTWTNWKAMIVDRSFTPKTIKKKHVVVNGADGVLDATESIAGRVLYGNQKLTIKFKAVRILSGTSTESLMQTIESAIHGKRLKITFDDAKAYSFTGRCTVNIDTISHEVLIFTVECDCEPDIATDLAKKLDHITVTYSGGAVYAWTSLNELKGITVTAHYSNGSTARVTNYQLSGEIEVGQNTITVSYEYKTATFTVTGLYPYIVLDEYIFGMERFLK